MPALLNARHERFAQELARGNSISGAYEAAGYRPGRPAASKLATKANIRSRVAELTERAAKLAVIDKAWVLERLARNARISMGEETVKLISKRGESQPVESDVSDRDGSVANKALELLGKELGMFIDRAENLNTIVDITDRPMTEEEWAVKHGVH